MATRSFLLDTQLDEAEKRLESERPFPQGVVELRQDFSKWLEERLLDRLKDSGDFLSLDPILIGSWARHELCPKSDIDLLFAGPEDKVREFTAQAFRAGLKLRARTPENPTDWTVGVEPFDILALQRAKALTSAGAEKLAAQQKLKMPMRRSILKAIRTERLERHKRQDSISSYLEPNLKFGTGGLRDIEQALALKNLFPERFLNVNPYPFQVLQTIKEEWLYLRSRLHLMGAGDILSAHDQLELTRKLKMDSVQELMKFIQSELERASFYADWVCVHATAKGKARSQAQVVQTSLSGAVQRLKENPDLLLQFEIRLQVDALAKPLEARERGRILHKAIFADCDDDFLVALYRTRLLEVLIPDLKKLKGLVQHDHYHRFTADAHLMQALREVQRVKTQSRSLGPLAKLTSDLTAQEWWTLKLTALFHDLAKGRKGDHSTEGAKLAEKYLSEWEIGGGVKEDVTWLVENHLLLSTAAFRHNPQAPSTWKRLFDRGVQGRRLILLALFTAIDIRATNPEAWSAWKAQLLLDLVENLRSPQARSLQQHLKFASESHMTSMQEWLLGVDPVLLELLPPQVLVRDLKAASAARGDLPPLVLRRKERLWVRFHRREDDTGVFLNFVKRLYGFGLNIQIAAVCTLPGVGVYDWFCLRTEKTPRQVSTWLALPTAPQISQVPKVRFQVIELIVQDQDEWIISFRGRDQRGLLLAAAQALVEEKLSLRSARVHTWGQQIDDIFSVRPLGESESLLQRLRNQFVT